MEKLLIISAFSFLFTLIGTKLLKNFLENKKIFDIPNERSSHLKPIPTGGGWIINLCIIGIIIWANATIENQNSNDNNNNNNGNNDKVPSAAWGVPVLASLAFILFLVFIITLIIGLKRKKKK